MGRNLRNPRNPYKSAIFIPEIRVIRIISDQKKAAENNSAALHSDGNFQKGYNVCNLSITLCGSIPATTR